MTVQQLIETDLSEVLKEWNQCARCKRNLIRHYACKHCTETFCSRHRSHHKCESNQ